MHSSSLAAEIQLLSEALAKYYAENPALAFKASWEAHVNNLISLNEAALAIGATTVQFLELVDTLWGEKLLLFQVHC